jgi:hypothetical protein
MASETFTAFAKPLKEFLFNEDANLHVPSYQREFSWEKEQLEAFWENLISPDADRTLNFCGSFLVLDSQTGSSEIVDGQQRATVVTIALCVIRDIADDLDMTSFAEQIQYSDIQRLEDDMPSDNPSVADYKLEASSSCLEYFRNSVQQFPKLSPPTAKSKEEKRVLKAYQYFRKAIQDELAGQEFSEQRRTLRKIRGNIRELRFVLITVYDHRLKFELFEALNARGLVLSPADLIKNFLMSQAPDDQAQIAVDWQRIATTTEEIGFQLTDIIRYYWNGRHTFTTKKNLFSAINREYSDRQNSSTVLLGAIRKSVEIMHALVVGNSLDGDENHSSAEERNFFQNVQLLRHSGVKQHLVLLLVLVRNWSELDAKVVAEIAKLTARFSIAHFALCQEPGNKVETFFATSARAIEQAVGSGDADAIKQACSDVRSGIAERWPHTAMIQEGLESVGYESTTKAKKLLRTLFAVIELEGGKAVEWKVDELSIDLIQSETPTGSSEATTFGDAINEFGNLAPIHGKINAKFKNRTPVEKTNPYSASPLSITAEAGKLIENNGEWTVDMINQRTSMLREKCMQLLGKPA